MPTFPTPAINTILSLQDDKAFHSSVVNFSELPFYPPGPVYDFFFKSIDWLLIYRAECFKTPLVWLRVIAQVTALVKCVEHIKMCYFPSYNQLLISSVACLWWRIFFTYIYLVNYFGVFPFALITYSNSKYRSEWYFTHEDNRVGKIRSWRI